MTLKLKIRTLDNFQGSLTDRTFLAIREAIMELNFLPGEIIRKHDICNTLGVSRSPVSEALAKLRNEGLVEVVPQSGTFVSRFSLQDIKEGAFLREAIELACIEILASNISEKQLIDLNRNLKLQKVLACLSLIHDGLVHPLLLQGSLTSRISHQGRGYKRKQAQR